MRSQSFVLSPSATASSEGECALLLVSDRVQRRGTWGTTTPPPPPPPPAHPLTRPPPSRVARSAAVGVSTLPSSPHHVDTVVREFHEALARSSDMAVAVAAIQALTSVIKASTAQTMMGLEKELKDAAASLQRCNPTSISLKAGCELFLR